VAVIGTSGDDGEEGAIVDTAGESASDARVGTTGTASGGEGLLDEGDGTGALAPLGSALVSRRNPFDV